MNSYTSDEIKAFTQRTIAYYDNRTHEFWEGTRDHDVSQNIQTLLQQIQGTAPYKILDFGCGPGRDLQAFIELGHNPTGLDGSAKFCEMARKYTQCEVLNQDFMELDLPSETFDGIFANASLFHVGADELPRVLTELHDCLKPNGVLFSSNPRGNNQEDFNGSRYSCFYDWSRWKALLEEANFRLLTHYYRPAGLPRHQQPWLASAWQKLPHT